MIEERNPSLLAKELGCCLTSPKRVEEPLEAFKFCRNRLTFWALRYIMLGKAPKETYVMLVRVYEDQSLSKKCMYEWLARFREGQESVSDNPRSRGLAISVIYENTKKLR
ncbi:hypothetical protein TNCV_3231641 [Trichonephila clavipes]|nr:hypothetical protein TNCV_3231641 [Trichonephila clavipes]